MGRTHGPAIGCVISVERYVVRAPRISILPNDDVASVSTENQTSLDNENCRGLQKALFQDTIVQAGRMRFDISENAEYCSLS